jgi:hypothetical protein
MPAFRHQHDRAIGFLRDVMAHIGIVTPWGIFTGREGGVGSGATETNWADTTGNEITMRYVADRLGVVLLDGLFMGDDSVVQYQPSPPLDEIADVVRETGMLLNVDKTYVSSDFCHFLQRLHHVDYVIGGMNRGVYSTVRALGSMKSLEYKQEGLPPELFSLRWIMQSENCKWHPRFDDFVVHWSSGDTFLQHRSPEALLKAVGGVAAAEGLLGITAFPGTSHTLRGLSSFATVEVLRRL